MKNKPLVSVIMPVYNGEDFISEAIESVLIQTYSNLELIVINDASRDNTESILKSFSDNRICVITNNDNLGVAESRNKGIDVSKGRYIAFIDADDIWEPNKIEMQLPLMDKYKLICSSYDYIDEQGIKINRRNFSSGIITKERLLRNNVIGCSTVIIDREILKNNKFSNDYKHEDYALWLKIINDSCTGYCMKEYLVHYRMHAKGRNFNKLDSAKNRWIIYRKMLHLNIIKSFAYFTCYIITSLYKHR